jgi:hypothetical protein
MPDTPTHNAALDRIASAAQELDAALGDLEAAVEGTDSLDHALAIYGMLHDVVNAAKDAAAIVGAMCIEHVPDRFGEYMVPGGGVFKIGGGRERKRYDQDRLISAAADAIRRAHGVGAIVTTEGEVLDAEEAAATLEGVVRTTARLAGATAPSFSAWRSTIAKTLNLNLNEYADLEDAPLVPRIEGRARH